MTSFDRPRGGGDSGGDKPPTPQPTPYIPYPPTSPPQARDREGTAAGGDHSRRPGDTIREADKHADTVKRYQALFDRQGELIDTQKQRIDTLKTDIGKLENRNQKLEDRNEKLEARLEQRDQAIDRQAKEIGRLKTELENRDKASGEQSRVEQAPNARSEQNRDVQLDKADRPWYTKIPSHSVTDIAAKTATAVATIGVATGTLNPTAEKIAGGVAAIGLAVLEYKRQKNKMKGEDDG
ncbi:MAG: hypothetical protein J2P25_03870 [Nocardiopsaceae bacterium]|nr:hypothetical protein [Nocardiopsaceae bacterium]